MTNYCSKCNKDFCRSDSFCEECGHELKKKKVSFSKKTVLIGTMLIVGIIITLIFFLVYTPTDTLQKDSQPIDIGIVEEESAESGFLEVEFEPLSIKEGGIYTIFDTEEFYLEVTVTNHYNREIETGQLTATLLVPSREDFTNVVWSVTNQNPIPKNGKKIVSFTPINEARYIGEVSESADFTFTAEVKYGFSTEKTSVNLRVKESR